MGYLDFGTGQGNDAIRSVVGSLLKLPARASEDVRREAVGRAWLREWWTSQDLVPRRPARLPRASGPAPDLRRHGQRDP